MKKKLMSIMLAGAFMAPFALASCNENENIYLNGSLHETIDVYGKYEEEGATYPEGYEMVMDGSVDVKKVGRYALTYHVYDKYGNMRDLYRYVDVIDRIAPSLTKITNKSYYYGETYAWSDFVSKVTDNYDTSFTVDKESVTFDEEGLQEVKFTFTDSSGNETIYDEYVNVQVSLMKMVEEKFMDSDIFSQVTENGVTYDYLQVSEDGNIKCFPENVLVYTRSATTKLGTIATIELTLRNFNFADAYINYVIDDYTGRSSGTVAIASADILESDVTKFKACRVLYNDTRSSDSDVEDEMLSNYQLSLYVVRSFLKNDLEFYFD